MLDSIDWGDIFGLSVSPIELIVRGTAMFWFLYVLFRYVLRREVGSVAMADILIFVIIADAAQNALSGEYKTVTDGMILVGTIVGWNVAVDWAAYHVPFLRRIFEPAPLVLVRNGRINLRALRAQLLTIDDLKEKLRDKDVEHIDQVKLAVFEPNGDLSVIRRERPDKGKGKDNDRADGKDSDRAKGKDKARGQGKAKGRTSVR